MALNSLASHRIWDSSTVDTKFLHKIARKSSMSMASLRCLQLLNQQVAVSLSQFVVDRVTFYLSSSVLSCDDLSSQSTATSDPSLHFASPSLLACRRVDRNLRQTVNRRVRLEPSHSATPPSEHENKFVSVYPRPSVPLVSQISPPPVPAGIPFQSIHSASPFYSTYIPSFLPPEIPAVAPPPSTVYPSSVMHPMAMPYPPSPSYPALYPSMGTRTSQP